MDVRAQNIVTSGNGWKVIQAGDGYEVWIESTDRPGSWRVVLVQHPATEDRRLDARDLLLRHAPKEEEERIDEVFAAPWIVG